MVTVTYAVDERVCAILSLFCLILGECQAAATAVDTISMGGHEDTSAALGVGALSPETSNLVVALNSVVLQDGQGNLLLLVGDSLFVCCFGTSVSIYLYHRCTYQYSNRSTDLGSGVGLLLSLLGTSEECSAQVESAVLGDGQVNERHLVSQGLSSEGEHLLFAGDELPGRNGVFDGHDVSMLINVNSNGSLERLNKDLHDVCGLIICQNIND